MPDQTKMQRSAEDKAVQPAEDKTLKAEPQPRFAWEATSADGKAATHGHWRIRVQQSGATGLWRPFVEFVGDDYGTADAAEKALERVLR